ncbi:hypothetical protein C0991_004846 [Blastosporella zonata]|nr:hypothetical protein C0991_004846 [Blastosporella zonata]
MGSPVDTQLVPPTRNRDREEPRRKWMLRTDSWFDPEAKKLRVMLEVPGVSKSDVRVTLSTCPWNRVKQITVTGVVRPVFPSVSAAESADGMRLEFTTIRERKFGEFERMFAVPAETNVRLSLAHLFELEILIDFFCFLLLFQREDVEVSMKSGILFINVPCGIPVAPDAEDVPIH